MGEVVERPLRDRFVVKGADLESFRSGLGALRNLTFGCPCAYMTAMTTVCAVQHATIEGLGLIADALKASQVLA